MRHPAVSGWAFPIALTAFAVGLAAVPTASADPTDGAQPAGPAPSAAASVPAEVTPVSNAAVDACKQFSGAMNYAAANYEDFAYATAGTGNYVNYSDPTVDNSNVTGRTALRQAAAAALSASQTPDLQPDIAAPMRSWSLEAAKLVIIMGIRGGGDRLNSAATELNKDAHDVQMACAAAGTRA